MLTFALVALAGLVVGTALQEFRWRVSANSSEDGLLYAERAFQNGDDRTALNLFSKLATNNNPNAEYWLGQMYEIALGIPRDAKKAIDLYKKGRRSKRRCGRGAARRYLFERRSGAA